MTTLMRRARTTAAALAALLALASCGTAASFPDREPDAVGTLAPYPGDSSTDGVSGATVYCLTVDEGEYPYYQNAVLYFDEDTFVGTNIGETLTLDDLSVGDWVEVWTDACAESYPVQCGVTHVRLTKVVATGPPTGARPDRIGR